MWWQQLHVSEGWCGVREVAVEGRLAQCQPPIRVFLGWNCTNAWRPFDDFSTLSANFNVVKKKKKQTKQTKKHPTV